MKRVAFFTLGCKVNQYETDAISEIFKNRGYVIVDFDDISDVYIINTCTVTSLSDRKSRQMIRKAKKSNGESIIAVIGCYAQTAAEEIEKIPEVDIIVGTKDRHKIADLVEEVEIQGNRINIVNDIMKNREFEELNLGNHVGRTRAFLKIQEGCTQFCSYCIIPYARGPVRSRQPGNVIKEVRNLADHGFKEVVLTGIHIASYGRELQNTSLADIITRIHSIEGIERIRIGSLEPLVIDEAFIQKIKPLKKLCPHFHISLQSGCDATLKRMNRKYTTGEYKNIVNMLRENIEDTAITTDVMVGFPGETEEEFQQTLTFLKEINLSQMHIFKFSPRKGTPAATYEGQVPAEIKDERSGILLKLTEMQHQAFIKQYEGRQMDVLFEQRAHGNEEVMEGLTGNYLRVLCPGNESIKGEIRLVEMKHAEKDHLTGVLIQSTLGQH